MKETNAILVEILNKLNKANVKFLIAGGVAVVLHGVERLTMDIDTSISFEKDNVEKFLKVMTDLGLTPRLPMPAETLLDDEKMKIMCEEKNALVFTFIHPENPTKQIDVFLDENLKYENLIDSCIDMKLDSGNLKVLSKEKLVELKLKVDPMRDKDMFDIKELQKLINNEQKNG